MKLITECRRGARTEDHVYMEMDACVVCLSDEQSGYICSYD